MRVTRYVHNNIVTGAVLSRMQLVKDQQGRDEKVDGLLETMRATLDIVAGSDELTSMQPFQEKAVAALMKQTTECGYFIVDYRRKGFCEFSPASCISSN